MRRIVLFLACIWPVWLLRTGIVYALRILLGGVIIALLIAPLQMRLEKRVSRGRSVLCAWLCIVLPGTLLLVLLPGLIMPYIRSLCEIWPEICRYADPYLRQLPDMAEKLLPLFPKLSAGIGVAAGVFSALAMMITVSVFLLLDRERYIGIGRACLPARYRQKVTEVLVCIGSDLKRFVAAQAKVGLCVGGLTAAGLLLIGMPGALLLGTIAGVCNLIPYFGPVLAAIPVVLAAVTQGWMRALMAAVVLIAVQQIDGLFISPRVLSGATGLPPVAVLLSLAAGGAAFGITGMLLAVPGAIAAKVVLNEGLGNRRYDGESCQN